ncbi:MAG: response regulator [Nitrospirae bacterium]|nr:response regulator [Nitrospirota bacterium]
MANILIVEDSPTMRQLIMFALKRLQGVQVAEASDGVEAMRKLAEQSYDVVLADINMPVMDGLKLVGHMRSNPRYKHIPVVIITTEGAEEDKQRALSLGANAYLMKPIQTQKLLEIVSHYVKS